MAIDSQEPKKWVEIVSGPNYKFNTPLLVCYWFTSTCSCSIHQDFINFESPCSTSQPSSVAFYCFFHSLVFFCLGSSDCRAHGNSILLCPPSPLAILATNQVDKIFYVTHGRWGIDEVLCV
jgi:hypothetical protein